ncbi:hypothetical protein SAMN07250955_103332 [Arboricoccus pini]|uniref:Uncharacterized protein n=1 Tax=Arboricoccus pini TaxID=1963835 RepID=A0A212QUU2_9PROT|nr:hypothetical protein [Arboricoccus pini]SNB63433.1 hypothetical protein SAMN07250955_103332 [Arboricoccus pini]
MLRYLTQTRFPANRPAGLALILALALIGCVDQRVDRPWVEANSVPDRPPQEYTLSERQAIRNDLTTRGAIATHDAEELRYQVGLRPDAPPPLPPEAPRRTGEPPVRPPPAPPNVRAAYLKQQIETEFFDVDLAGLLYRLPDTPIDVDAALAAGTLRPVTSDLERVTLRRFEPLELEPTYPQRAFTWLTPTKRVPPLNRLLNLIGITPQPRLAAPLQTPEGEVVDRRLGASVAGPPTQNNITSVPVPVVPPSASPP